jgi:hypothetical protein
MALKDSVAYNPWASREETGRGGEVTSGLLSPCDQGRLGRQSVAVKDKTAIRRERWGKELNIWAATRMGKI